MPQFLIVDEVAPVSDEQFDCLLRYSTRLRSLVSIPDYPRFPSWETTANQENAKQKHYNSSKARKLNEASLVLILSMNLAVTVAIFVVLVCWHR